MTKSIRILSAIGGLFLGLAASTSALAQDAPPAAAPPPPAETTSRGSGSGAGIGVGAAAFLSGISAIEVVYDTRAFHLEGLFGFTSIDGPGGMGSATNFQFGARGWYHAHTGSNSDFSLGGGVGVITASGGGESATTTLIEPGMQSRVFLTPNFNLHVTAGLTMVFGDDMGPGTQTGFGLTTQFLGGFGFAYFFR